MALLLVHRIEQLEELIVLLEEMTLKPTPEQWQKLYKQSEELKRAVLRLSDRTRPTEDKK